MDNSNVLRTGFSRLEYTPDFPVGLSGYGGDLARKYTEIISPVCITCVAAQQDEMTVLLYTVDTCGMRVYHNRRFRNAIEKATGVPADHIFFGATHGHNCPSMEPESEPTVAKTIEIMEKVAIDAAKAALADMAETTIFAAKPIIPGMNFTRHYRLSDGRRRSTVDGLNKNSPVVSHIGPNDSQMVLVKFARPGKKDIILLNWQAHPDDARKIGFSSLAAGFVAPVRNTLEALSGCHVAYFTGASGNQVRNSMLPSLAHDLPYDKYGEQLGQMAFDSFSQFQAVECTGIQYMRSSLVVDVNHSGDHLLPQAEEIVRARNAGDNETVSRLCREYGFRTSLHANGVRLRASMAETDTLELCALRIGGIGFAINTCETFSDQGLYIKNYSPMEYTMVITGNRSYLAADAVFDYQAYEAVGGSAYYVRGTAEKMASTLVDMLQQIF